MYAIAAVNSGSPKRRSISSGVTSSMWVWIHHTLPNGSRTRPTRSPNARWVTSEMETPPASTAWRCTARASSTYRRRNAGVAGQLGSPSNSITIASPMRTSACPITPRASITRPSSSAPNALRM